MLFLLIACATEPEPVAEAPAPAPAPAPKVRTPKYTQADLAEDPNAFTLSGVLRCPDNRGSWTVAVWPFHPEFFGPSEDELPWHSPLVSIELERTESFSIRVPQGDKRLILAYQDEGAVQAFADAQGSYLAVNSDVSELVVDCGHTPQWPDGIAPVSEQGKAKPVREDLAPAEDAEWLYKTPSGRRSEGSELRAFEARRDEYERRFASDPNSGDIAASLSLLPEEAAEQAAREMERR